MAHISKNRLLREIKDVTEGQDLTDLGISVTMNGSSLYELSAKIRGPPDTPYEKGDFKLSIKVPLDYPFKAPEVKFETKVWHPNVSSMTGVICLDILKENWCASMTLRAVLLSIQSMLCSPEPNNPQDAVVARQYLNDINLFKKTAKFWAQHFANAPGVKDSELTATITQLVKLGHKEEASLKALSNNDWNEKKATENIQQYN